MITDPEKECVATVPSGVGDAVGVEIRKWFVAIVNHNTEKAVQERLERLGYETYVAKQTVVRVWRNGRKAKVDKVIIPSLVFIKCTQKERHEIVSLPYIKRFMTDKAGASRSSVSSPLAVIPQSQIDTLRYMLGQSDIPVSFADRPLKYGDLVAVARGSLRGIEGEVVHVIDGKAEIIVRIGMIGAAKMTINETEIELKAED